jgi:uncharacterized protein (UPF0254 family)
MFVSIALCRAESVVTVGPSNVALAVAPIALTMLSSVIAIGTVAATGRGMIAIQIIGTHLIN